jgi:hypothetical protein
MDMKELLDEEQGRGEKEVNKQKALAAAEMDEQIS